MFRFSPTAAALSSITSVETLEMERCFLEDKSQNDIEDMRAALWTRG